MKWFSRYNNNEILKLLENLQTLKNWLEPILQASTLGLSLPSESLGHKKIDILVDSQATVSAVRSNTCSLLWGLWYPDSWAGIWANSCSSGRFRCSTCIPHFRKDSGELVWKGFVVQAAGPHSLMVCFSNLYHGKYSKYCEDVTYLYISATRLLLAAIIWMMSSLLWGVIWLCWDLQHCSPEVTYLGHALRKGQRFLYRETAAVVEHDDCVKPRSESLSTKCLFRIGARPACMNCCCVGPPEISKHRFNTSHLSLHCVCSTPSRIFPRHRSKVSRPRLENRRADFSIKAVRDTSDSTNAQAHLATLNPNTNKELVIKQHEKTKVTSLFWFSCECPSDSGLMSSWKNLEPGR